MLFHEHLKKLRQELGLTQEKMAELLNMERSSYCRLEHNESPPVHYVERISSTFNVDAFRWLERTEEGTSQENGPAGPRVIHMSGSESEQTTYDRQWRSRAVDLLSHITNLVEQLLRNSRWGGG